MAHMNTDILHAWQDDPECPVPNVLLAEQPFEDPGQGQNSEVRPVPWHVYSSLHTFHGSGMMPCLLGDHHLEPPPFLRSRRCCRLFLRLGGAGC